MDERYLVTLAHEFNAGSESFLIQLRINLHWDKEAFDRLTEAMRLCCKHYEQLSRQLELDLKEQEQSIDDESLIDEYQVQRKCVLFPDWLALGFWDTPAFVRGHTAHLYWKQFIASEPEYYEKAYERLDNLASWFFTGRCPWIDEEKGWASTFVEK